MLSDNDLRLIDNLFERHRQPAIMLHLPYPPHSVPTGRSKVGGKPNLPAEHEWATGKYLGKPVPLHFYAQIDCAELPFVYNLLPRSGMLFFFGCDIEQDWGSLEPQDDCRVIYVEHLPEGTPLREPPEELPPLLDRNAEPDRIVTEGGLPGEAGPNLHVEWPLIARAIETWPEKAAFMGADIFAVSSNYTYTEVDRGYNARLQFNRLKAFSEATGVGDMRESVVSMPRAAPFGYAEPPAVDGVRFPQFALIVDRIARHVLKEAMSTLRQFARTEEMRRHCQSIIDTALQWVQKAHATGPFNRPSEDQTAKFNAWLASIALRFPSEQPPYISIDPHRHVHDAIVDAINTTAFQQPKLVPGIYYIAVTERFSPYGSFYGLWSPPHFHQMLGHASFSQHAKLIDSTDICLLQLRNDTVRQMSFGDCGEGTFWIKPADLAARRFDKAWGTIEGA
jgi:uncharacterized protein YwqG